MIFDLDRRQFVAALGAAAVAPSLSRAVESGLWKAIPASGELIPAVGMGSWLTFDVGGEKAAMNQRTEVLRTFFELGGGMVDSSPMYGTSQSVIGYCLSQLGHPASLFSADKVWVSGGENGPPQIAQSEERWGVDKFDLMQVHNLVSWRAHLETLFEMKAEGRLRYVGVTSYGGLRYDDIESIMTHHPIDFVQITYNLVDREAESRLLPLALEKGIAVIANRPFREGPLIDRLKRDPLPAMAAEIGAANWAQFLLKFLVSHPAVTVAIPATRRVDHMKENMGALHGPMPDQAFRTKMISVL